MGLKDFYEQQKRLYEGGIPATLVTGMTITRVVEEIEGNADLTFAGAQNVWHQARRYGALVDDDLVAERVRNMCRRDEGWQPPANHFAGLLKKAYELE